MTGIFGLSTPPNTTDPNAEVNFSPTADAFFQSLPTFAENLANYGTAISAGFTSTCNYPLTVSAVTPGSGAYIDFFVEAGKGFANGMPVVIADVADPIGHRMIGTVLGYDVSNGWIRVGLQHTQGVGFVGANWIVCITAPTINSMFWNSVNTDSSMTLDCRWNVFLRSVSGAESISFSNVPAGQAYCVTLLLYLAAGSVTWPAQVRWPFGLSAPTMTTGRSHMFTFLTIDGGAYWMGSLLQDYLP